MSVERTRVMIVNAPRMLGEILSADLRADPTLDVALGKADGGCDLLQDIGRFRPHVLVIGGWDCGAAPAASAPVPAELYLLDAAASLARRVELHAACVDLQNLSSDALSSSIKAGRRR